MARQNPRGVVFHLIWRFVDRSWFFNDEEERSNYLRLLGRALSLSDWRCLAYALMSNHIHLCVVAGDSPMSSWSKRVNSPFVRWMNERHGRLGSIIADRAKDYAVLPADEADVIAYIHNNPVEARVVTAACESTWTSHRAYLGLTVAPPWLAVEEGLARCGLDRHGFDEWVQSRVGRSGEVEVSAVRRAIRNRGAINLATPARAETAIVPLVTRPFGHVRPDPRRIVALSAEIIGESVEAVCSRRRSPGTVAARRVAVYCGIAAGLTGSDMAAVLGMSPQGVSYISSRPLTAHEQNAARLAFARVRFETTGKASPPRE
jgi:REP element-mobilizing transposase RayT